MAYRNFFIDLSLCDILLFPITLFSYQIDILFNCSTTYFFDPLSESNTMYNYSKYDFLIQADFFMISASVLFISTMKEGQKIELNTYLLVFLAINYILHAEILFQPEYNSQNKLLE
jgi:ABC-type uncharacterized transport system fused permease/ATPase subunit